MIDKIKCDRRVGYDIEPYVIACLSALRDGWIPPLRVTEEEYKDIKEHKEKYPDYLVGYCGYQLSYGGKFFGGYRRDKIGKRDYCREAYNFTFKQVPNLAGIEFGVKDYRDLEYVEDAVIYCDPPYRGTTKYDVGNFEYEMFYDWCRRMGKKNTVLISEYEMPKDFECIWSKSVKVCMDSNRDVGEVKTERLFRVI